MEFKAVIFDLFGTLVNNFSVEAHKTVLSKMASLVGAESDAFIQSWFNTFHMRCIGAFQSIEENIVHVCEGLNIYPDEKQIRKVANIRFEFTRKSMVPKMGVIETLITLKELGYKIGLISDCSTEVPKIWDQTPFAKLFNVSIFSCKVGMKKPDIQIYKQACSDLSVSTQHCLYIGDGGSNELSGARSAGMFPIQICDTAEVDAHRIDEELWDGNRIHRIPEVLNILDHLR